jgi:uncharacterized protein (DUF1684 family)
MKGFCVALFMMLFMDVAEAQTYVQQVMDHRSEMNVEFGDTATSILPDSIVLHGFHGLNYFDVDPAYRVTAKFKRIKNGQITSMKTSGTKIKSYRPYGTLTFRINGKKCKLTLYQMAEPSRPDLAGYLLLAFTDKTNGFETYGGGRYLDFHTKDITDEMVLDFNYCYNPYCAYTDGFNCVIPPIENVLPVEIKAGAKKWHE